MGTFFEPLIRSFLQMFAGFLVAHGIIAQNVASGFVDGNTGVILGAILWAASYVWSVISKKKA